MNILLIACIALIAVIVGLLLDISTIALKLTKSKEVVKVENSKNSKHQFIKGLF